LALAGRLDRRNAGSVATDAFTGMLGGPRRRLWSRRQRRPPLAGACMNFVQSTVSKELHRFRRLVMVTVIKRKCSDLRSP